MAVTVAFAEMNWMQIEQYAALDSRVVIPLGATEQHGYLSVLTDTLVVSHIVSHACQQAGVLMAPTLPFGCSAFAINFHGTISLKTKTLALVIEDIVDSLYRQGFRRIVFVSGHGGNEVISGVIEELQLDRPQLSLYYKNGWDGMKAHIRELETELGLGKTEHASWHEEFSFTKVADLPQGNKEFSQSIDFPIFPLNPRLARQHLGDGVVSGAYSINDEARMLQLLQACIENLAAFLHQLPKTPAPL